MKNRLALSLCVACLLQAPVLNSDATTISLADQPLFSSVSVPGNLALVLSVEWPTATTPAYPSTTAYASSSTYLGYFDPEKCYTYSYNSTTPSSSYFQPYGSASSHKCSSSSSVHLWSGNFMNWASTQTLDAFRWVLTGGYRSTDTSSATILTKTNATYDSASVMPDKSISTQTVIAGATPFLTQTSSNKQLSTPYLFTRLRTLGTRMWLSVGSSSSAETSSQTSCSSSCTGATAYQAQSSAVASTVYEVYVNVKVCDSSIGVESNCVLYGTSTYKPEGLMQTYASKLRYAAFGYLNDDTTTRDGGVLRAPMKYIGPTSPVPGAASVTNSAAEWSSSTGIMATNPDASYATATTAAAAAAKYSVTISNSGVMNYLNKFGNITTTSRTYKSKDPVSELYYTAVRYFKNLGNVSAYSSLSGATSTDTMTKWLDDFPVVQTWSDPILYACQKNFILGIGDVNTWLDANLPGTSLYNSSYEPTTPTAVSGDTSVSVTKATNMVATLEGLSGLSTSYVASSRYDTYYLAGLAYDSHTVDMRSDLSGSQTINTYWMDVLEGQTYSYNNVYYLATKYGGFTVPSGFSPYASSNSTSSIATTAWHTNSDTMSESTSKVNKRPDNYYPGNSPSLMQSGLTTAFAKIASELSESLTTAYVTATPNESLSGASYAAGYNPKNWTGSMVGSTVTYASDGTPTTTEVWDAASLLDSTSATARQIITCCTSAGAGLAFTSSSLSGATLNSRTYYASFSNVPGVSSSSQSAANFVNYLRGDRTNESTIYRARDHVLGDIVNSKVLAIGAPSATYYDVYNPGYATFKKTYASRKTVVFAGSNDGMLHAFDGTATTSGGSELFAYVPSFVYGDSSTYATSGLAALGNPSYSHYYRIDGSPQSADVNFNETKGNASTAGDWHTILVGGLGKGGNGYFALDVTDPTSWTSEAKLASKVLWEFTTSTMGYSYGDAQIVKTAKYGWVVLVTSGYNNSDGKGYLYLVDPKTGDLLESIATSEGTTSAPINMGHVTAYVPDETSYVAESAYAADMQGNVWRYDLTGTGSYSSPTKIAKLTDASSNSQPVSSAIRVAIDSTTGKRYVLVGTGKLLADSDITTTDQQTFYAIVDGTSSAFYTTSTLPTGYSFPLTRSKLTQLTDVTAGVSSAAMGWYFDLPIDSSTGIAYRVAAQADYVSGIVAFSANLPNGEVCNPSGSTRVYAVAMSTGKTVLDTTVSSTASGYLTVSGLVTDLVFKNIGGTIRLLAGSSSGTITSVPGTYTGSSSLKRLNWREVPTAE